MTIIDPTTTPSAVAAPTFVVAMGQTLPTVLKAAALFTATEADRYKGNVLTAVRFERGDDGTLRLVATNSYILATFDTLLPVDPFEPFNVAAADLVTAGKVMGTKAHTYAMRFVSGGRDVEFIGAGNITVPVLEGDFPQYRNLLPDPSKIVDGMVFAFSPKWMGVVCKAALVLDKSAGCPVRYLGGETALKPQCMRVIVQDVAVMNVILMPVRIP